MDRPTETKNKIMDFFSLFRDFGYVKPECIATECTSKNEFLISGSLVIIMFVTIKKHQFEDINILRRASSR